MSVYPKSRIDISVYNPSDVNGLSDISSTNSLYVLKSGDDMTGDLSVPTISSVAMITFSDGTRQTTASNDTAAIALMMDDITALQEKTQNMSFDTNLSKTYITGNVQIDGLTSLNYDNKINTVNNTITGISYNTGLLKTSIANNFYASNLSAGNFNSLHLSGTTDNIQNQINNINSNITNSTNILLSGNNTWTGVQNFGNSLYNNGFNITNMLLGYNNNYTVTYKPITKLCN